MLSVSGGMPLPTSGPPPLQPEQTDVQEPMQPRRRSRLSRVSERDDGVRGMVRAWTGDNDRGKVGDPLTLAIETWPSMVLCQSGR